MLKKRLSVIVPAYNEEKNIAGVVSRIKEAAAVYCEDYEIIIINDRSQDSTGKIIDDLAKKDKKIKPLHNKGKVNFGFGGAYLKGLKNARFEYVMLVVGDNTNPVYSLRKIISKIGKADMIIPHYLNFDKTKTKFRYFLSISFTYIINRLTGLSFRYYNGLTLHRTDLLRSIPNISTGFGFSAEMVVYLAKKGATFIEVGVVNEDEKADASTAFNPKNIIKVLLTLHRLYLIGKQKNAD